MNRTHSRSIIQPLRHDGLLVLFHINKKKLSQVQTDHQVF